MAASPPQLIIQETISLDLIDTIPVLSALISRTQGISSTQPTSPTTNNSSPLSVKDIPAATDELKHKLQKARVQVKQLPDVYRSIDEQEEEIKELEARILAQRAVLEGLRDVGLAAIKEEAEKERVTSATGNTIADKNITRI